MNPEAYSYTDVCELESTKTHLFIVALDHRLWHRHVLEKLECILEVFIC